MNIIIVTVHISTTHGRLGKFETVVENRRPFPTKIKHAKYLCVLSSIMYISMCYQSGLHCTLYMKILHTKYYTAENVHLREYN